MKQPATKYIESIAFNHSPIPTYILQKVDNDFIIVGCNNAGNGLTKGNIEKFFGIKITPFFSELPIVIEKLHQCINEKTSTDVEGFYRLKSSGELKYISAKFTYAPPDLIVAHAEDITERKKAEQELRESEHKFRKLAEILPAVIYIYQGTRLTYVSPAIETLIGYSADDLQKINYWEIIHPDQRESVKKKASLRIQGEPVEQLDEFKIVTKDGQIKWFHISSDIVDFEGQKAIIGSGFDITDYKNTKDNLQRSTEQYQFLYEQTPMMYFTVDRNGLVLSVNQFGARQLGYEVNELTGKPVINVVFEEDKPIVQEQIDNIFQNPSEIAHLEFRKVHKNGIILWVKETVRAVEDNNGKTFLLIICEDISLRKQMQKEKEKLQHELAETEKLVTLGQFTAAIAHEINNPLDAILSLTYLLNNSITNDLPKTEILNYLDKIKQQTYRIRNIAKSIIRYGKPRTIKFKFIDINKILMQLVNSFSEQYRDNISIHCELNQDLPQIEGDEIGLEIVFKNIILNSIESFQQIGTIDIHTDTSDNGKIKITFKDDGEGISPEDLDRIFEPFFSVKDSTKSTGLGLTICKKIIEQHNGSIMIESEVKKGTLVTITLGNIN